MGLSLAIRGLVQTTGRAQAQDRVHAARSSVIHFEDGA